MGLSECIIAGCGPGSIELITNQVQAAVDKAEILAGSSRLLDLFPKSNAKRLVYKNNSKQFIKDLAPYINIKKTVILVSGDPGIASLAKIVTRKFNKHLITRLPGISSIQLAFAKVGIDWMDAIILNGHSKTLIWNPLWIYHKGPFAILISKQSTLIFAAKLAIKLNRKYVWKCEQLSIHEESIKRLTPDQLLLEKNSNFTIIIIDIEEN